MSKSVLGLLPCVRSLLDVGDPVPGVERCCRADPVLLGTRIWWEPHHGEFQQVQKQLLQVRFMLFFQSLYIVTVLLPMLTHLSTMPFL